MEHIIKVYDIYDIYWYHHLTVSQEGPDRRIYQGDG